MTAASGVDLAVATRASGLLRAFNIAGVLAPADVHVAARLGHLGEEADETVLLAAALAVRAVRGGSVCIDLGEVRTAEWDADADLDALSWPERDAWYAACRASSIVGEAGADTAADRATPLRLVGDLLYLDRYWRQEQVVREELHRRAATAPPAVDEGRLRDALRRVFGPVGGPDHQRLAAAAAAAGWLTVVAGGPGTGKTTAVARLLAVLHAVLDSPRVALAAPTGRAAARLQEAVAGQAASLGAAGDRLRGLPAATVHRLLGWRPDSRSRFRHDRRHRLPYDVVVVDETSMVSLTLMSRLLEAVRPDARLVLVGDPDQLASVEAGAVLGDLVGRPGRSGPDAREEILLRLLPDDVQPRDEAVAELRTDVVRLRATYRYRGAIAELAAAIRAADPDRAVDVLRGGADGVELLEPGEDREPAGARLDALRDDVVRTGRLVHEAAAAGDGACALDRLRRHRLLCAHRQGPYGVGRWGAEVERWLSASVDSLGLGGARDLGRPLLVTANDYELGLFNGDIGVVVADGLGGVVATFASAHGPVTLPPSRLSAVETVHAMTVHKSQGSQFERVTVLLPPEESPLLTRELLYTAVTRAEAFVRVVGSEAAVRAAVLRPIARASGLRRPD